MNAFGSDASTEHNQVIMAAVASAELAEMIVAKMKN